MELTDTERRVGRIVGMLLYVFGAGMLFVLALNATVLAFWPNPPFPVGGFPTISVKEDCEKAEGAWQGADLAVEGGYCLTQAEQARNALVDKSTLATRVANVAAGAVVLLAAVYLVKAGFLVRLGLVAGGAMVLAAASGMPLLFVTVSSQTSYLATYGGTGNIPVAVWEAVLAVIAWVAVLWGGYNISREG